MRKVFNLLLPFFVSILACAAARAQPAQQRQTERDARCRQAAMLYIHPSPDKEHLTVEAEDDYEYRGRKKYLRLCGNSEDDYTRSIKEEVAVYEAALTLERLLPAASKAGSPESKDPTTYSAIAAAYESKVVLLNRWKRLETRAEGVKAIEDSIGELTDFVIDAYARAVAACGAEASCQAQKAEWTKRLAELYRSRHGGSDTGLDETIRGVLDRPLPELSKR